MQGDTRYQPVWHSAICLLVMLTFYACPDATQTEGTEAISGTEAGNDGVNPPTGNNDTAGTEPEGGIDIQEGFAFGDVCDTNAECESGFCFSTDAFGEGVCTIDCDADASTCPEGWACQAVTSLGDVCVPIEPKAPCTPCDADWECGTSNDYCLALPNEPNSRFCTEQCFSDSDCLMGFSCTNVGRDESQCVPDSFTNACEEIMIEDEDQDGVADEEDNCLEVSNPNQEDNDMDGHGDACDNCVMTSNPDQMDGDMDSYGDACDTCPDVSSMNQADGDMDGYGDVCDNCPNLPNPEQTDSNMDDIGDACEVPNGTVLMMGSTASSYGFASNGTYSVMSGSFAQRPLLMSDANYQLRAFPTYSR